MLVNDDLTELAAFVGLNNCGYTFSIEDKSKNDKSDLWKVSQDKQAWELISKNAAKTGDQFLKESVHSDYFKGLERANMK